MSVKKKSCIKMIIHDSTAENSWEYLSNLHDAKRAEIELYKMQKDPIRDMPPNPVFTYMNEAIFFVLNSILESTLEKAKETNSLKYEKSPFNAVDYIAEMLWNLNPRHPDRQTEWLCIHDMEWVKEYLRAHPRPYFPFSYLWNRDAAAKKIQAYMRGHWVRCRENVQEVRVFWKKYKEEQLRLAENISVNVS